MIGNKILTICEYGNSRSVALSFILKGMGKESIACGMTASSHETFMMLCNWADTIIVTFEPLAKHILPEFHHKLKIWDVGVDKYFMGYAPELLDKYDKFIKEDLNEAN